MSVFRTLLRFALLFSMLGALPGRGDEITRRLQEELRKRNLYFGDVDGRRTAQVAAALRRYQQRKDFPATGEADETTLRSLTLLPPAPRSADTASPTPAGVAMDSIAAASPWPDLTVLRSDLARPSPVPADIEPIDIEPTPSPTIAPPPAAVAIHRSSEDAVRGFLESYLRAGQSNDTEVQMPFYGSQVDYFDDGKVNLHYIHGDIDKYDRLWPERRFTLLDPITLLPSPDHDPEKIVVNFHYRFAEKRRHDAPQGETANIYTLQSTGPGTFEIIAMKEHRVPNR